MDPAAFKLQEFVESLDLHLAPGLFKIARVEPTDDPTVVTAVVEPLAPRDPQTGQQPGDASLNVWVMWLPSLGLLRMHANLELCPYPDEEERVAIFIEAANQLNERVWEHISKASIRIGEGPSDSNGRSSFALLLPHDLLESEEGLEALRLIVGLNLARLSQEIAISSVVINKAVANAKRGPQEGESSSPE